MRTGRAEMILHRRLAQAGVAIPLALIMLVGCATFERVDPELPVDLSGDWGLLIVDVDTEVPLQLLQTASFTIRDVEVGRQVWMARVRVGEYRWRALEVGSGRHSYLRFKLEDDEEFRFNVEPGKINYPGQITVRRYRNGGGGDSRRLFIRNRNHAGMSLKTLRKTHTSLLQMHPITYSGSSGDRFLDYYSSQSLRILEAHDPDEPKPEESR